MMHQDLTNTKFWDAYWEKYQIPVEVDFSFSFDRCIARELKSIMRECSGKVFEVGCAPGKWLAYISKELGLLPGGIEYSDIGLDMTRQNFKALDVRYGELFRGDFFDIQPRAEYDVVLSLGFIEHFNDPDIVVKRHIDWLKPGGLLVLGVPNFRGIYEPMQRVLDESILTAHNLDIMSIRYFSHMARRFGLSIEYLKYVGGFEPSLPISKAGFSNASQFIVKATLWAMRGIRGVRLFDNINGSLISSYILMACRKDL